MLAEREKFHHNYFQSKLGTNKYAKGEENVYGKGP